MISLILCLGLLIQVPQDYPTITEAVDVSSQGDTIWVHPNTYPEQLWLPSHDILLVSEFFFTGDSSALYNTIIDASDWAEEDTASAVVIVKGSTRATIFSGFTVTGGHGTLMGGGTTIGGAFYIKDSSPVISSNIISGNQADGSSAISAEASLPVISANSIFRNRQLGSIIGLDMCSGDTAAIIEGNNIGENSGLPENPECCCPRIGINYSDVIIRSNYFHDYSGFSILGAGIFNSRAELSQNIFENLFFRECPLQQPPQGTIIWVHRSEIRVSDNIFRNCSTFYHPCLFLNEADVYGPTPTITDNVFENIVNTGDGIYGGGSGILVLNCDALISGNNFTHCAGVGAAIGISIWSEFPSCSIFVTENEFIGNDYYEQAGMHQASAISIGTDGTGIAILRGNVFTDNQKIAVDLLWEGSDSYYMDAERNFWGDSSGPYHPTLNPSGRGDTIAGRVDFDPWLTENDIDNDKPTQSPIPQTFTLLEPYPNPFNPGVTLPLSVTRPGVFNVVIFDLLGRRIWEQTEQLSGAGIHRIYWPGVDAKGQHVAAGIYFARATSANQITPARKLVLLK
ncbi:T9SS type A sorting domain-containing protein [bacterium]|nr:T9SS type A sorting domain-containing protein [bacterium]